MPQIMNRNLTHYCGESTIDHYNSIAKTWHLDNYLFGSVLVSEKHVRWGMTFSIRFSIYGFRWKPKLEMGIIHIFHWLFFLIKVEGQYHSIPYQVIANHLNPDHKPVPVKEWLKKNAD